MLTKIEIITRSTKLDDLLRALNRIGVMGITVSQVFGCGLSKGHQEIYRGKKYESKPLFPKFPWTRCSIPASASCVPAGLVTAKFSSRN